MHPILFSTRLRPMLLLAGFQVEAVMFHGYNWVWSSWREQQCDQGINWSTSIESERWDWTGSNHTNNKEPMSTFIEWEIKLVYTRKNRIETGKTKKFWSLPLIVAGTRIQKPKEDRNEVLQHVKQESKSTVSRRTVLAVPRV